MATETIILADYTLSVDTDSGAIVGLRRGDSPESAGHVAPVVTLGADVAWKGIDAPPRYISHTVEGDTLAIDVELGPLVMQDRYTAINGILERRVVVRNATDDEIQLTGVRMALGGIAIGDPAVCLFEAPANTVRARLPLKVAASQPIKSLVLEPQYDFPPEPAFAPGARVRWNTALADAPDSGPGLLIVHNPDVRWSLLTWYVSDIEAGTPWTSGDGTYATFGYDAWVCGWMASGATLTAGVQYILLHPGEYASALDAYVSYFTQTGILPPVYGKIDSATDWTGVYEVHPGFYGGFRQFAGELRSLSELGIDTIYMLPVMQHRNKKNWPWDGNWEGIGSPYAMHDFTELEPSLGTEQAFREMVDTAHDLGMKVLMDLVAQGSSLESHYVQDHPEWYARDEQGDMVHSHGWNDTWSIDWANPDYHAYMLDWTTRYVKDFKVDGYRVDAPHGKEPNWDRKVPYHASFTNLGATPMLEELRRRLLNLKPQAQLYCELFGPLWIRSHDISNDYHPYAMAYEMFHGVIKPHEFNEYLRDYWAILPKAEDGSCSPRICFTETHDTRYWPDFALRGSMISRALLGILVVAGFVPMFWAGQEKGQEDFIHGLLISRRSNAVLRRGKTLYNEVVVDDQKHYRRSQQLIPQEWVHTLIRYDEERVVWGVASLFAEKVTFRFELPIDKLPIDPAKTYRLRDLITYQFYSEYGKMEWTGAELSDFTLTPEMYTPYMFRLEAVIEA